MTRHRMLGTALGLILVLVAAGCGGGNWFTRGHREAAAALSPDTALAPGGTQRSSEPPASDQTAPVNGWLGPGGRPFEVAVRSSERESGQPRLFGRMTLSTSLRARPLGQYPCTACHQGRKVVMAEKRVTDAHQNIQPVHPRQTGARCATCHAPENVELLALENGKRASLNESYRLCADCHFAQVNAWAAGAHGKRLDGWQGRRVVMACPDCHDPHDPALVPRIPYRAPRIARTGGPH
jgi:uncharacterized protein YlaI